MNKQRYYKAHARTVGIMRVVTIFQMNARHWQTATRDILDIRGPLAAVTGVLDSRKLFTLQVVL